MSSSKKIVTTYSKSLFQNVKNLQSSETKEQKERSEDSFEISKIISKDSKISIITVYSIGEELLLIRSLLLSAKNLKEVFNNPTYAEQKKLEILLSIFPGLTVTMKSFLKILMERSHLFLLPKITDEYTRILLKFKNSTRVKIAIASILEENYGTLLLKNLKSITSSTEIILQTSYNPKLLGGLVIDYNSTSIDASILREFSLFFNEV